MKNSLRRAAIVVAFCCALLTPCAFAVVGQPGSLDTTWSGTGKVITAIGSGPDAANSITLQPDGKVLLAGFCYNGATYDFCAARYLANGSLDTTWNGTGKVTTAIGSGDDYATSMTLQPDGRVLLAGYCTNGTNNDFCAARYLANGTLDTSWNSTGTSPGKVITPIGTGSAYANAMTLQPDGKVLLAGYCLGSTNNDFCAARYLANGTLDSTWNGTGTVITAIGSGGDYARAMTLQPDGKVLLAGNCSGATTYDFCAARYLANGTLDITWSGTGTVVTPIVTGDNSARSITLQPDGKVLLAGRCYNGTNIDFCAARYLANGTLDSTWNGTGKVITAIGSGDDAATSMTLQPDGKVLLAGVCRNGTYDDFCAARYLANGTLDTAWNGTGKVTTPIGNSYDTATAMTLQPDGKVLLAGYCSNGAINFCAARYDGGPFGYRNCTPDIDGDGSFLATTDALINMRIALGITGPAVIGGITFAPTATRNTWPLIRDYLVTQCGMSLVQ